MRVTKGKVINGKIVVETTLQEGSTVTVIATEEDGAVEVSSDEEAELLKRLEEADRGDFVEAAEVLQQIRRQCGQKSSDSSRTSPELRSQFSLSLLRRSSSTPVVVDDDDAPVAPLVTQEAGVEIPVGSVVEVSGASGEVGVG